MDSTKNQLIHQITDWENGVGEGNNATANFASGGYKAVTTLKDMMDRAGRGLPEYLGITAKEVKGEEGEGVVGVRK